MLKNTTDDPHEALLKNKARVSNTKCKRKRGLFKKCTDIARICNLKVSLIVYDEN